MHGYYYPAFQALLAVKVWRQRQLINSWKKNDIAPVACDPASVLVAVEVPWSSGEGGRRWSLFPADWQHDASSALQFSMGRILIASATLLCTFHTNSSDGHDATHSTVKIRPIWGSLSWVFCLFEGLGRCEGMQRSASPCHLGFGNCLVQFKD